MAEAAACGQVAEVKASEPHGPWARLGELPSRRIAELVGAVAARGPRELGDLVQVLPPGSAIELRLSRARVDAEALLLALAAARRAGARLRVKLFNVEAARAPTPDGTAGGVARALAAALAPPPPEQLSQQQHKQQQHQHHQHDQPAVGSAKPAASWSIEVTDCKLVDADARALAEALLRGHATGTSPTLLRLDLSFNALDLAGVEALAEAVAAGCSICELALAGTCFSSSEAAAAGVAALGRALAGRSQLYELDLSYVRGVGPAVEALMGGLTQRHGLLRKLSLVRCQLGAGEAALVARALAASGCQLEELDIGDNRLGDAGWTALAAALRANRKLRRLLLWRTHAGPAGAREIVAALRSTGDSALEVLDLHSNGLLGDEGATVLASALVRETALRALNVSLCEVGDPGALALAAALRGAGQGRRVDMLTSRISERCRQELRALEALALG